MTHHTPHPASAGFPDALPTLPERDQKTTAVSSLSPVADTAGFSEVLDLVGIEIAAARHEGLCEAVRGQFGHSGVVGLRVRRSAALHARMARELAHD